MGVATQIAGLLGLVGLPALIAAGVAIWAVHFSKDAIAEKMKAAIKAEYDQRLETLKANLKASGDVELERHKQALSVEAMRHNVRYARLHETRATVIGEVYAALSETYDALRAYTAAFEPAGAPSKDERLQALGQALKTFRQAFVRKKIFLPKSIADQLDRIHADMFAAQQSFLWGVHLPKQDARQLEKWIEVSDKVDGPIKAALEDLEAELRRLMGDDELPTAKV